MGKLIDINDIRVKPQYMQDIMGIAMIRCEDLSRILADVPTVEAIPKADYEARLKADMVAMLEDLKKEMNLLKECEYQIYKKEYWNFVPKCQDVIQQKIDALKEVAEDGKKD